MHLQHLRQVRTASAALIIHIVHAALYLLKELTTATTTIMLTTKSARFCRCPVASKTSPTEYEDEGHSGPKLRGRHRLNKNLDATHFNIPESGQQLPMHLCLPRSCEGYMASDPKEEGCLGNAVWMAFVY